MKDSEKLAKVTATMEHLRLALEEYGRHKTGCTIWAGPYRVIDPSKRCSCGLAAAIAAGRRG